MVANNNNRQKTYYPSSGRENHHLRLEGRGSMAEGFEEEEERQAGQEGRLGAPLRQLEGDEAVEVEEGRPARRGGETVQLLQDRLGEQGG